MRWNWWRVVGVKVERHPSYISFAATKWDKLPQPTEEKFETGQIPVEATTYRATNFIGWFIIRYLLHSRVYRGEPACTHLFLQKRQLTFYPLPRGKTLGGQPERVVDRPEVGT